MSDRETCPYDTNGDGDCGKPLCPYCGKYATPTDRIRRSIRTARTSDVIEHTAVAVPTDEAEALCDLADAFREWENAPTYTVNCDCADCVPFRRKVKDALNRARAALARLDGGK